MEKIMKRLLSPLLLISFLSNSMEKPEPTPIIAEVTHTAPSLKQLAATSICKAVHPQAKVPLEKAKSLALKVKALNGDLKEYLLKRLTIENADAFIEMNSEQPIILTKKDLGYGCRPTDDGKKLYFLQEQSPWGSSYTKLEYMNVADAAEGAIDLSKTPYRIATIDYDNEYQDHFIPNEDGSKLALVCFKRHNPGIFLISYDCAHKQCTELIQLPTRHVCLEKFSNNQIFITNTQQAPVAMSYRVNTAINQILTLPQKLQAVSPSTQYTTTYDNARNVVVVYKNNPGNFQRLFECASSNFPSSFNEKETHIATIYDNFIEIRDIQSNTLLNRIQYPFIVSRVNFKNDHTIIVQANLNSEIYETDMSAQQTKCLVKSVHGYNQLNNDATLSLSRNHGSMSLQVTEAKKEIKKINDAENSYEYGPGFCNNDRHLLIKEVSHYSSFRNEYLKRYPTHLAFTNGKTLEQLLDACIKTREAKEKKGWLAWTAQILASLNTSG